MKLQESDAFVIFKEQINDAICDLKTKGKRHKQIPNLLTLMRLTAPCFIIPAAVVGNLPLIVLLTAFFSLTDLADGFIARNFKLTSELGATLDAITDKVFASTLLLAASFTNPILLLNLGLECSIAGINVRKKLNNKHVQSSLIGKIKTWFLFGLVGVGFVYPYFNMNSVLNNLSLVTSIMQVFTITSYLKPVSDIKKSVDNEFNQTTSNFSIGDDYQEQKLEKEKTLVIDSRNNEALKQLKEVRELLVSEREFLRQEKNDKDVSNDYQKSKKNDFKKN